MWGVLLACLLASAVLDNGALAQAQPSVPAPTQTWPTRQPIKVVVPFTAGSAIDVMARLVLGQVSRQVGQVFVVENRPGAGGTLGMAAVAKAEPDGYTLLVNSSVHTITPSTYQHLPYDTLHDFAAVIPLGNSPNVLVVPPGSYASVQALVAAGKDGSLTYGSGGVGAAAHLNAERFLHSAGFKALHVPFKGAPEALTEIMAGRLNFYFAPLSAALPLVRDGRVQALAVSTSKRSAALPDVPTTIELGFPDSDYNFWAGMFAPAATSRDIVHRLHDETAKALATPEIHEKIVRLGAEPMPMSPEAFDAYVRNEIAALALVVKAAGITPN